MRNLIIGMLVCLLMLTSCGSYQATGAAYGGMGGALLGGSIGGIFGGRYGRDVGTLVGAAIGATAGSAVGAEQDRRVAEAATANTEVVIINNAPTQQEQPQQQRYVQRQEKQDNYVPNPTPSQQFYGTFKDEATGTLYIRLNQQGAIAFGSNEANIARSSAGVLSAMADYLATIKNDIYIYGSCDSTEDDAMKLSQKRGDNVATYFANKGISRDRIHVVALGCDSPITDNTTDEGRAINRSAEVYITDF